MNQRSLPVGWSYKRWDWGPGLVLACGLILRWRLIAAPLLGCKGAGASVLFPCGHGLPKAGYLSWAGAPWRAQRWFSLPKSASSLKALVTYITAPQPTPRAKLEPFVMRSKRTTPLLHTNVGNNLLSVCLSWDSYYEAGMASECSLLYSQHLA